MPKKSKSSKPLSLPEFDFDLGKRERIDLIFKLTLSAPLSHIMPTPNSGNRSAFNKLGILGIDRRPTEVPILSAAQFRTLCLREAGIGATLRELGLKVSKDVHNTLFSGGFANSGDSSENNMALYDRLERYFAPLATVGCCKPAGVFGSNKTQYIHGQIDCGHLYLNCFEGIPCVPSRFLPVETAEAIAEIRESERNLEQMRSPDGFRDLLTDGTEEEKSALRAALKEHRDRTNQLCALIRRQVRPYGQLLHDYHFTRKDAAENPKIRALLASPECALLEGDTESERKQQKDSSKMIASTEVAIPGCEFIGEWRSAAVGLTRVGIGFVAYALLEFGQQPVLGGQAARGAGGYPIIEVWYAIDGIPQGRYLSIHQATQQLSDRAASDLAKYREYLDTYRQYLAANAESGGVQAFLIGA